MEVWLGVEWSSRLSPKHEPLLFNFQHQTIPSKAPNGSKCTRFFFEDPGQDSTPTHSSNPATVPRHVKPWPDS